MMMMMMMTMMMITIIINNRSGRFQPCGTMAAAAMATASPTPPDTAASSRSQAAPKAARLAKPASAGGSGAATTMSTEEAQAAKMRKAKKFDRDGAKTAEVCARKAKGLEQLTSAMGKQREKTANSIAADEAALAFLNKQITDLEQKKVAPIVANMAKRRAERESVLQQLASAKVREERDAARGGCACSPRGECARRTNRDRFCFGARRRTAIASASAGRLSTACARWLAGWRGAVWNVAERARCAGG